MYTTVLSTVIFFAFAMRTPVYQKLYKEFFYSVLMGAGLSYIPIYQKRLQYLQCVDESYELVKAKFDENPEYIDKMTE